MEVKADTKVVSSVLGSKASVLAPVTQDTKLIKSSYMNLLNSIANDLDFLLNDLCKTFPQSQNGPGEKSNPSEGALLDQYFGEDDDADDESEPETPTQSLSGVGGSDILTPNPRINVPEGGITNIERLVRTHPIWYLPMCSRAGAVNLLQNKPVGTFLVRQSSKLDTMALSLRQPPETGQIVEHYLIEHTPEGLRIEGSFHLFQAIPLLIDHYCQNLDELPCKLVLPPSIANACGYSELSSLALLGQEFWNSPLSPGNPVAEKHHSKQQTVPSINIQSKQNTQNVSSPILTTFSLAENDTNKLQSAISSNIQQRSTGETFNEGNNLKSLIGNVDSKSNVASTSLEANTTFVSTTSIASATIDLMQQLTEMTTATTDLMQQASPLPSDKSGQPQSTYFSSNLSDKLTDYEDIWRQNTPLTTQPVTTTIQHIATVTIDSKPARFSGFSNPNFEPTRKPPIFPQRPQSMQPPNVFTFNFGDQVQGTNNPQMTRVKQDLLVSVQPRARKNSSPAYAEPYDSLIGKIEGVHNSPSQAVRVSGVPGIKKSPSDSSFKPTGNQLPPSQGPSRRVSAPVRPQKPTALHQGRHTMQPGMWGNQWQPSQGYQRQPANQRVSIQENQMQQLQGNYQQNTQHPQPSWQPNTNRQSTGLITQVPVSRTYSLNQPPVVSQAPSDASKYNTFPQKAKHQIPTAIDELIDLTPGGTGRAYQDTLGTHTLGKFPTQPQRDSLAETQIPVKALEIHKPTKALLLENQDRFSAYDNVSGLVRSNTMCTTGSIKTVFEQPWDSSLWDALLTMDRTTHSEQPSSDHHSDIYVSASEQNWPNSMPMDDIGIHDAETPRISSMCPSIDSRCNETFDSMSVNSEHIFDLELSKEVTMSEQTQQKPSVSDTPKESSQGVELNSRLSIASDQSIDNKTPVKQIKDLNSSSTSISTEYENNMLNEKKKNRLSVISGNFKDMILPLLSTPRLISLKTRNREPGVRIRDYISKLAVDKKTTFGSTVENFIQCTRDSTETNPSVVVRNIRQFMNGIKNYLVKHGEGQLEEVIERERTKLKSDEFLNIDVLLEGALHRCVVKPLKDHIYRLYNSDYNKNGNLSLMSANINFAKSKTAEEIGVKAGLNPPPPSTMDVIKHFFSKMQRAYSPVKKLENLLGATSAIYNNVQENNSGRQASSMGADDFLPMFIYVLVQCGMVMAEVEADYMWGLLHPSVLNGEGGYYLTTLSSAVHVLKNFHETASSQPASLELSKARSNTLTEQQGFIRVAMPDEFNDSIKTKTLPVRPNMTTKEVCNMIAHKFKIINANDYALYSLINNTETKLLDNQWPNTIKIDAMVENNDCVFVYKRDAKFAWPTMFTT
ncbi:unnamed protein product [Owenia fusiformis]|uniref:Protein sprint n=1 Tax=Owenia fusiformis TaxID=6347 RepID=A0A8S4PFS9_OWEFU|nr:unnamed protein product [Owenia fusiformis]